jgi:methionyl-tRNA formyltransferase
MKLIYLGTPEFAVPSLEALVAAGHTITAVYTQPDRPKGRGQSLGISPVKEAALRLGLPVRQPLKVRHPDVVGELRADSPDAMVIVGYGQIIPQAIIDIPPHGIINVHGSLLPKYRGAAPIQWAVANGEETTGVTTMRIDAGLDTGDMLLKAETEVGPEETSLELGPRLAEMGARLIVESLAGLEAGTLPATPQDPAEATLAPILTRDDGRIDWMRPAAVIHNRARGFLPWPGAWTTFRGQRFNIWRCRVAGATSEVPGRLFVEGKRLFAACGEGSAIELLEVQVEGRKRTSAADFLNGQRLTSDEVLGGETEK